MSSQQVWHALDGVSRLAALPPEATVRSDVSQGFVRPSAMPMEPTATSRSIIHHPRSLSDITWDAIVSIEPLPPEPVYDIEVEDTHNFVANGIIAHNTYLKGATADNTAAALNVVNSGATSLLYARNDGNVGVGTCEHGVRA